MKKILVIRLSSLGDVVLAGPILTAMRLGAGIEVHLLTKPKMGDLLHGGNGVDRFYTWGEENLWKKLRAEKYDGILDLHHNLRSIYVLIQLLYLNFKHAYSEDWPAASYSKKRFRRWLFVKTKWSRFQVSHVQDRYAKAAKTLLDSLDPELSKRFQDHLSFLNHGLPLLAGDELIMKDLPSGYGVAILGGTYLTKKIPKRVWDDVFQSTEKTWVLLGSSGEVDLAKTLVAQWGNRVLNKVGAFDLKQSAQCIEKASMVVGGDTGFTHVAAAFGRPLLVIWGNTHPGLGFAAGQGLIRETNSQTEDNYTRQNVIHLYPQDLSCHPCSKLGFDACPKGHFRCMNDYSAAEIKLLLQKLQGFSQEGS